MSLRLLFDKIPAPAIQGIHPHIIFGEHENAFSNLNLVTSLSFSLK